MSNKDDVKIFGIALAILGGSTLLPNTLDWSLWKFGFGVVAIIVGLKPILFND